MAQPSAPSGLSALLRGVRGGGQPLPPRPEGRLVWLHLPGGVPDASIKALQAVLEDVTLLMTSADGGGLYQPFPGLRKPSIDRFLAHWQPDLLLWGAPEIGLTTVRRAKRAGVKMLFADLAGENLPAGLRNRQLLDFLRHFEKLLLEDGAETARFLGLEIPQGQLRACNPLSEIATPLPESEALLRRISGAVGPRPIWCAAMVSRGEIGALMAAHRHAVKAIPNLMLVVVPRAAADVIGQQIEADGWRMARICDETLPEAKAEVLLAKDGDDLGTWLRLATVSYMGGTLYGPEAADPFDPVALGSAVLCGPAHAPFERAYKRLAQAGSLALVETNGALAAKLVETLAPDQSAQLALSAWQVGSEGAEAIDVLAQEITAILEQGAP